MTAGTCVSVLSNGDFTMCGSTTGNVAASLVGLRNQFIRSYSADGNELWTNQTASSVTGETHFNASTTDLNDNTYAVGTCSGTWRSGPWSGGADVCVVKFDSYGQLIFERQIGSSGDDVPYAIAVDDNVGSATYGTIYIGGTTNSATWEGKAAIGTLDGFVLKIPIPGSPDPTQLYRFGVTGQQLLIRSLAVDSKGDVWMAGDSSSPSYLSGTGAGERDILVQKIRNNGAVLFGTLLGSSSFDYGEF